MIEDLFEKIKPHYGRAVDLLKLEYLSASAERKLEIEELVSLMAAKVLGLSLGQERILLKPPVADVIGRGDYFVGLVVYPKIDACPFRIARDELLRHVFILGPTGTGKSTLIIGILMQLLKDKMPFMIFDFKRNYRCLSILPFAKQLSVCTIGRTINPLPLNVLQAPAGISVEEWVEALADIISSAYLLMHGARNVLKSALLRVLDEKKEKATLRDALDLILNSLERTRVSTREYGWLESTARSLEELCSGVFGDGLNSAEALSVEDLLARPIVFELEGLGNDQRRFFCLYFLQAIFLMRKKTATKREMLGHVLVFDESHNVFPRVKPGEEDLPSRLAREIREYGEAIIAASQESDVSESLLANAGFKFVLRCDYPRDVWFASKLMQIEEKWFPKIPLGYAVVRIPVRHLTPFLLHFPPQEIKNAMVADEDIAKKQCLPVSVSVSAQELMMLRDVVDFPISTTTQRYSRLSLSADAGNKLKNGLLSKKLAYFDDVSTGKARARILALTKRGKRMLAQHGMDWIRLRRGGGEHEYWRHVLKAMLLKHDYSVKEEHSVGEGKAVDLFASLNNSKLYIEIETGASDVMQNYEKCKGLSGKLIFFFTNKEAEKKYAPTLNGKGLVLIFNPKTLNQFEALLYPQQNNQSFGWISNHKAAKN